MIAPNNVTDLLSIGQIADELGVCVATMRNMVERGCPCHVLPSSHRRFKRSEVFNWIGRDDNQSTTTPIALTARVSSRGQNQKQGNSDKSSLEHQIDRIETYATERFGSEAVDNASKYYRVASGLNHECPVLTRLISDILAGKFKGGYVVVQDELRIMRFGVKIFEQICKHGECEIIYVMLPDTEDAKADLTNSLLGIITHFTAKASGLKSKEILEIQVTEETLTTLHRLRSKGYSLRQIATYCKEHNLKGTKGQTLSSGKIWKLITSTKEVMDELSLPVDNEKTSFEEFVEDRVRQTYNKKDYILRKEIVEKYSEWCKKNDKLKFSPAKISRIIKQLGWVKKQNSDSVIIYRGIRWK